MNEHEKVEFEEMFLKDAAVRMVRANIKYDPMMKKLYQKIKEYGLNEREALMLIMDISEISREVDGK